MRRAIPLLLLALCAMLFLSASYPPYVKSEVEIAFEDEAPELSTLRTPVSHRMRIESAGGHLALYERLLSSYGAKDSLNYLAIGLGDYLSAECERRRVDPLNATLEWTKDLSSPFIYYEEHAGREIDLAEAGRKVARAMDDREERARVRICAQEVPAAVTVRDLRAQTKEMARFSTDYSTSGENRRHNIALAARAISGEKVEAGESFSFNATVGERTAERGFREANIVVGGEFVKGIGGGVCQVSTTLYNTALLAGLVIENAAAHSRPVSYVPYSRDCTVSSAIDFRFRNDTSHPIYVVATLKSNTLTFVLFGERKEGKRRLESEVTEEVPFRALYEDGGVVREAAATLLSPGRAGIRSRLYLVCEKGGITTRALIRENYYPAKDALYKRAPCEKKADSGV